MRRVICAASSILSFIGSISSELAAQSVARPESLLPEETWIYLGTDDVDLLIERSKGSPVGKVFQEQEVREFLEQPLQALHAAVESGLQQAKQHPALANVELDPAKLFAGPYGRAFAAVTHLDLPEPGGRIEPGSFDIGLVIGIEARQGAVDLLGTLEKALIAFSETEGGPAMRHETIDESGCSYDRFKTPDGVGTLCFASIDGVRVLALSEKSIRRMFECARAEIPSLQSAAAFARGVESAGPPARGDAIVFADVGRAMDVARRGVDLGLAANGEESMRGIAAKLFEVLELDALGSAYSTSTWRDGVAVTTGYSDASNRKSGLLSAFAPSPVDVDVLRIVPKSALGFSLSSFDLAPLWDLVMNALAQAAPEIHEKAIQGIREIETQIAGADEQGNPNWDIRRDLIGAVGGRTFSMSTPGAGSMLGPGGDMVGWIEAKDPARLEKSLEHLFSIPGSMFGFPITFKEQMHGEVRLRVLDPASLRELAMLAGSLSITYAIHDGRLWFSTSTKAMKKALDALATPPEENIWAKADFKDHYVAPPPGAVLTSLDYSDTASNFENGYTQILGVVPMIAMGMQQGLDELPFDMSLLPTAEAISQHLYGTVSMSYRLPSGANVSVSRGPFGPETQVALVASAGAFAGGLALFAARMESSSGFEPAPEVAAEDRRPDERARDDLSDLNSYVTVYMIEFGAPPSSLQSLVESTEAFPEGILQGRPLPQDPWGHPYAYKTNGTDKYAIWSFGPDGSDDNGEGDDIVHQN